MASVCPSLYVRCFSHAVPVRTYKLSQSYFVPRNTNGNLPVYSDIRNNGTRYLVLIRGVNGQAHVLAQELRTSLFRSSSSKLARAKVGVEHGKNIVIAGKAEKNEVIEWLKTRGF
ncbi:hypothetical protein Ac2012v2_001650 [Leucoagaricus gongylophorus]